MKSLRIDFACNDPDSGNFRGRVPQISIPAVDAELTAGRWDLISDRGLPLLRKLPGEIILSGKKWPVTGRRCFVGNWCWDAWFFRPPIAWAFLAWLHRRKLYKCEGGEVWFCELWDRQEPWPAQADQGFLVRWAEGS